MSDVALMQRLTENLRVLIREREAWCAQVCLTGECWCDGRLEHYPSVETFLRDHLRCADDKALALLAPSQSGEKP